MVLAQLELVGGDLHWLQTDGGVVRERRLRVHQRQRHGLQELEIQPTEQPRNGELALCGGAVETRILRLQTTVQTQSVQQQSHIGRWRVSVLRALDAPEVQQVEVAGQSASQWGEGSHGWHAMFPGQHGQCQHLMVEDGGGHVTEQRREADRSAVHRLCTVAPPLQQKTEPVSCPFVVFQALSQSPVIILHQSAVQDYLQLTAGQTGNPQSLCRVEREPVLAVLDVCCAGHGVEIGL